MIFIIPRILFFGSKKTINCRASSARTAGGCKHGGEVLKIGEIKVKFQRKLSRSSLDFLQLFYYGKWQGWVYYENEFIEEYETDRKGKSMSKRSAKPSTQPAASLKARVPVKSETVAQHDEVIVVNTDSREAPQPGDGLIASRKNKVTALLGDKAQQVSILLLSYNRLEKTKNSLESLLKYTADIDFELVLVDNGSTDGTLDYFKSIDYANKKVIRVTKNLGTYDLTWDQLSGRYLVGIPNDVYVTKNWLTNLLTCAMSDDRIGMVVPVSSNVSNYQNLDLHFNTLEEMWVNAAEHNVSDPRQWHERLRLLPVGGLYKREALDMAGKFDYGFFHDFSDDDITFRIRRAGYKTVLCKDTFVHHDHNYARDKDPEVFTRSLEAGRNDFKRKYYGVDAWEDVNHYETVMISLVEPQEFKKHSNVNILGIDVLCGTSILELKNKLREAEIYNSRLSAFTMEAKYWLDLKTICEGEVVVDRIEYLGGYFSDGQFDFILLGKPINAYPAPFKLLQEILKLLKKDGHLLIQLRNTYDISTLVTTMGGGVSDSQSDNIAVYQMRLDELVAQLNNLEFAPKKIAPEFFPLNEGQQKALRDLITTTGFGNDPQEAFTRAAVRDYVIDVVRK